MIGRMDRDAYRCRTCGVRLATARELLTLTFTWAAHH